MRGILGPGPAGEDVPTRQLPPICPAPLASAMLPFAGQAAAMVACAPTSAENSKGIADRGGCQPGGADWRDRGWRV